MIRITIYTADASCVRCSLTRQYLDELGIPYRIVQAKRPREEGHPSHIQSSHEAMTTAEVAVTASSTASWSGFRPDLIDRVARTLRIPQPVRDQTTFTLLPPGIDAAPERW